MNEKTTQVVIGKAERDMIEEIRAITANHPEGFEVTQRAVVSSAIRKLYKALKKENDA